MSNIEKKSGQEMLVEDSLGKIVDSIELRKRIIADNEYMEWLYNFTKTHSCFADNRWDYEEPRMISDEDYSRVNILDKFFEAIEEYFRKNLLPAVVLNSCNRWYTIKYKDVYFDIGICIGQGAYNYVERYEDKSEKYIEFEKIVADESDGQLRIKKERLLSLEHLLLEMKNLDVPCEAINKVVNKIF